MNGAGKVVGASSPVPLPVGIFCCSAEYGVVLRIAQKVIKNLFFYRMSSHVTICHLTWKLTYF